MKKYIAYVEVGGQLEKIIFETDKLPVAWLWERYGMSTYISEIIEIDSEEKGKE